MRLSQKLAQKMALTAQMKQSIHILQLPLLELRAYMEQQIEENPILEDGQVSEVQDSIENREIERFIEQNEKDTADSEDYFNPGYSQEEMKEKQSYQESLITKQLTLQEYLLKQLRLHPFNEVNYNIGEFIVGNIDENGYFQGSIDEIVEILNPVRNINHPSEENKISNGVKVTPQEVENMLSLIQTFEPSGVGARNLKECLIIQIKSKRRENSLAYQVVEKYLTDLAKNRIELIARRLKVSVESVKKTLGEISALEPKPGRSFSPAQAKYILPDVIAEKTNDGYIVGVNDQELPHLKINSRYKNLLNHKNVPEETKRYLKEKLGSVLWLIKAIDMRQQTIRRVAECILERQKEFFDTGQKDYLKPLAMKEVADIVGRNESTISRVVNNKYIQTPYGIFELKYFFSGSFKAEGKKAISTDVVKMRIATLIKSEDHRHPLSDDKIVNILSSQGINIARRTVVKYREKLKILPSYLRKNR